MDLYREIARARPDEAAYWRQYAIGLIKRGDLSGNKNFVHRGDTLGAPAQYRAAQPILDSLYAAKRADNSDAICDLAIAHEKMGLMSVPIGLHQNPRRSPSSAFYSKF